MKEDFVRELGLLSFVTRLKRLSDNMLHDGRKLYKELGMDIEPNWFVIFKLLQKYEQLTVTEIAEKIGFSHPSVISIANKMIKAGYLDEKKCGFDNRKRILQLTPKAVEKLPEFERVWDAGISGVQKLVGETDILSILDKFETEINKSGFMARTKGELIKAIDVEIKIFEKQYSREFADLNYEWISQLFKVENHDLEILENPDDYIIKNGGQIFLAFVNGEPVGTVALIKDGEKTFELAKMAVSPKFRGLKIGNKLMSACLDYAKETGAERVYLLSNSKLVPALTLYKKFGFVEIPLDTNGYERTDIQMELIFEK